MMNNTPAMIKAVLELYGNRIITGGDILNTRWCFVQYSDLRYQENSFHKYICDKDSLETLTSFMDVVLWEVRVQNQLWDDSVRAFVQNEVTDMRSLSRLVRISITGCEHGPSLFGCLEFLGPIEVHNRLQLTIALGTLGLRGIEFTATKMWQPRCGNQDVATKMWQPRCRNKLLSVADEVKEWQ